MVSFEHPCSYSESTEIDTDPGHFYVILQLLELKLKWEWASPSLKFCHIISLYIV